MEWGGWKLDEEGGRMIAPFARGLFSAEQAIVETFIARSGELTASAVLVEAVARSRASNKLTTWKDVSRAASSFNEKAGFRAIVNVYGIGYRMLEAASANRREWLAAILVEEFEATGPHARAAARRIEEVFR